MKAIRLLMGYSVTDMAEFVGVTRQTINNLETGKSKMTPMQFLSIAAVVDNYIAVNGGMYKSIVAILDGNDNGSTDMYDTSFSGFSIIRRWFLLFERSNAEVNSERGSSLDEKRLQQLVRGYKIFMDDTALAAERAVDFVHDLKDILITENSKLIIPLVSIERVQEQTQNLGSSQQAIKSLKLLSWAQQKNLVQIRGEDTDLNIRDTILSVFLKFRGVHRLCLITQDKMFANEVLQLNDNTQGGAFNIAVAYINDEGRLTLYTSDSNIRPYDEDIDDEVTEDPDLEEFVNQDTDNAFVSIDDSLKSWEYL